MASAALAKLLPGDSNAGRVRYAIFVAFVVVCFAGGGGARDDILSLLYVRPAAVVMAATMLLIPGRIDFAPVRLPLLMLAALGLWMSLQLVPLPPAVWTSLPGRQIVAEGASFLGIAQPWRPISISPDLTLNSLVSLVVPAATLLGFAALDSSQRTALIAPLAIIALFSAFLAIMQVADGPSSPFYLYRITNDESGVGLFANRNHQAFLLGIALPMLAVWASQPMKSWEKARLRLWVAALAGLVIATMVLVTGSRSGLALATVAAPLSIYLATMRGSPARGALSGRHVAVGGILAAAMIGIALFSLSEGRAVSVQRLLDEELYTELRLRFLPEMLDMAGQFILFGSGFGTFDPAFRIREPLEFLNPAFLNHAHNDVLELVITGGIPAIVISGVVASWLIRRSMLAFRSQKPSVSGTLFARAGAIVVVLLLIASIVDYPLRVPSLAMLFSLAIGWLGSAGRVRDAREAAG